MASIADSSEAKPVSMTAVVSGQCSCSSAISGSPEAPSIRRSVSSRANRPARKCSSASSALLAVVTRYPSCSRIAAIVTRTFGSSSTTSTRAGALLLIRLLRGQCDQERGPAAGTAAHLELAAVVLDDAQAHPEPEPGSLGLLGRVERLEDVGNVLLR